MRYLFGRFGATHILFILGFVYALYYVLSRKSYILEQVKLKPLFSMRKVNLIRLNFVVIVILYIVLISITRSYRVLVNFRLLMILSLVLGMFLKKNYFFIFSFFQFPIVLIDILYPSALLTNYFVLNATLLIDIITILLSIVMVYQYKLDIKKEQVVGVYVSYIFIFLVLYCVSMGTAFDIMGIYKPTGNLRFLYPIYRFDRVLYNFVYLTTLGILLTVPLFVYHRITNKEFISAYLINSVYY